MPDFTLTNYCFHTEDRPVQQTFRVGECPTFDDVVFVHLRWTGKQNRPQIDANRPINSGKNNIERWERVLRQKILNNEDSVGCTY